MRYIRVTMRTAALWGLVLIVWVPLDAGRVQDGDGAVTYTPSAGVPIQMYEFLDAWLVYGDRAAAMGHFDGSKLSLSLAPRTVRHAPKVKEYFFDGHRPEPPSLSSTHVAAYWNVLNHVWHRPDAARLDGIGLTYVLNPVSKEVAAAFEEELETRILSTEQDPFLVFEADSTIVLHSFDPGFGEIDLLLNDDTRTLGMLADLAHRRNPEAGPFVSFWGERPAGVWRIQALGTIRP